jgi:ketosteroid isomerase-like protein
MHPNAELIQRFYEAFAARDHAGMRACYAPDVRFTDEVFTLAGMRAHAMWHMLCENATDLAVTFRDIDADEHSGRAHWEAIYTFSQTGRRVHNILDATFTFDDGLIHTHRDRFDLWRWSRMALGPVGLALGWSPVVRGKVRAMAARSLDAFVGKHAEYR